MRLSIYGQKLTAELAKKSKATLNDFCISVSELEEILFFFLDTSGMGLKRETHPKRGRWNWMRLGKRSEEEAWDEDMRALPVISVSELEYVLGTLGIRPRPPRNGGRGGPTRNWMRLGKRFFRFGINV